MFRGLLICVLLFIGSTWAENENEVGQCLYDHTSKKLTFICFNKPANRDYFDDFFKNITCRNMNSSVLKTDVDTIKFVNCKMDFLPNLQAYTNLTVLNATNMGLSDLRNSNLSNLVNLTHIDLSHNNLSHEFLELNDLKKLKTLNLSSNPIKSIRAQTFASTFDSLEELNLANCQLNGIHPRAFDNFENLITVDLSKNKLIDANLLLFSSSFFTLRDVNLNENQIGTIYNDVYREMYPNLELVSLIQSKLKCFELNNFLVKGGWSGNLRLSNEVNSAKIYEINRDGRIICLD